MTQLQEKPAQTPPGQKGPNKYGQHRKSKGANRKFIAAGAIIGLAALAIVVVAMQGSSVYYVTIAQFHSKQANLAADTKEVRVAGKVVPGSIARDDTTKEVSFVAMDETDPTQTMKVVYNKIVPDTFKDEAQVVVTGTYNNGVFSANEMLAKCPSKYSSTANSN